MLKIDVQYLARKGELRGANRGAKHGDVIKWKHFPRCWPSVRGIHRSPASNAELWTNSWANHQDAGDLRRHRAHIDVTVMICNSVVFLYMLNLVIFHRFWRAYSLSHDDVIKWKIFRVTGCAGKSPATGEFPAQRPVTRSFGVFFDLRLYKRSSKQWWGWWFETPSHPLWRHCNDKLFPTGLFGPIVSCFKLPFVGAIKFNYTV